MQSLTFGYDGADRITRITNGMDATLTQNFQYDGPSRLTSVTSTADNESFQYDANGNRTSQSVNGVTLAQGIAATSNRLVSTGTQALGYDANGNLTTVDGVAQYHYDAFNRMDSATGESYYVNPEGQRLRKIGTLGTTFFAPDRGGPMLAEYANGGWVDYVWVNGRLIGRAAGGQIYAVHADQVGRPESVTNASRSIVWSANNFAFDRQVVTEGFKLNLGFPGQYYDDETKTWNNGYRDYRADLGRYVESDPIGLMGGGNTYAYVHNNPAQRTDISGLDDSVCGYNPSMCGMQNNVPPQDSFVFISAEQPVGAGGDIASGQSEGVLILGSSQSEGFYAATIGAVGGQAGTDAINYSRFQGYERSGGLNKPITLNEGNVGESVVKMGGLSGGIGDYAVTDPCTGRKEVGVYAHVSFVFRGRHYAIGIGSSAADTP